MTIKAATSKTENKTDFCLTNLLDNRFVSFEVAAIYTMLSRQRRELWEKPHIVQLSNLSRL